MKGVNIDLSDLSVNCCGLSIWLGWKGWLDDPKLHHVIRIERQVMNLLFYPRGVETVASEHPSSVPSSGSVPTMKIVYLCTDINNSTRKCLKRMFLMLLPFSHY